MSKPSNVTLIKDFFSVGERPVTMTEMKNLSTEQRAELAQMIRDDEENEN